jgi:hypothetical protein
MLIHVMAELDLSSLAKMADLTQKSVISRFVFVRSNERFTPALSTAAHWRRTSSDEPLLAGQCPGEVPSAPLTSILGDRRCGFFGCEFLPDLIAALRSSRMGDATVRWQGLLFSVGQLQLH